MLDYQQTQRLIKAVIGFKPQDFIKFMDLQAQMMGRNEQKSLYETRCFGEYFKEIFKAGGSDIADQTPLTSHENSAEIEVQPENYHISLKKKLN